ncbi:ParA family chromosome partitioning protein (plasmid) [Synechocystis sp. PCC 6803]|uniref:ParA family chromosome partitioning protein n=3 Tax=unclassified Synechocystis TaxID=2640012 RepID=Q6YRW8_SYNY3|nr:MULTISPECIES: ParA family protein [unclassified Synechocystis]AGF53745.1 ParA family chromosome partitioning protein [Synechocystis sp. PCC 6803]AVP91716.1 ParA family protein [Synechocystis sp. IPPAS B-1465]QWO82469.1 ParA family protein [Synechocystis sp. PCC 6803]BAD02093.1 ParA family chromosome partitioning protein [Synechocystis sp. PCC 6803]
MIITVASFKGGVGKTTTAVHLSAYLALQGETLLIDGDPNRSATGWGKRGSLPFKVVDERQAAKYAPKYQNIVIDTQARPEDEDLEALADGCDLLVIPSTPDALALDALMLTIETLQKLGNNRFRILLTIIPPYPSKDGDEARQLLTTAGLPLFKRGIKRYSAFQKASLNGVVVSEVSDSKAGIAWSDYKATGKEIVEEILT